MPLALAMGGTLWRFWHQRSHLQEGREVLTDLLARPEASAPTAERAKVLECLGSILYWQGDFTGADRAYSEELAIARSLGNPRLVAEALAVFEGFSDQMGMARVREGLVFYHHAKAEWTVARELDLENLRAFRAVGDRLRTANALQWLAVLDQFLGRFAEARAALAEAAEIFRAAGDLHNVVNRLSIGAVTAMSAGHAATAARICGAIAVQRDSLGDIATVVDILKLPDPERSARETLGDAAFEREFALGRALSLDEGIQLAVQHDAPGALRSRK